MSAGVSIAGRAPWLGDDNLQKLLALLNEDGEEARIAGGAVRNTLLDEPVADIDIATTLEPSGIIARCDTGDFKTVATGIDHGTVTVIADGQPIEVTTLRADIETDGRHAVVRFGRDWKADASRRDFTINALYADPDGTVHDFAGGLADIENRTIRFIGDAEQRIREDYLRILRFFRFFARYGSGRPDANGLKACARLKDGLSQLSSERIWSELEKTLGAADPTRAMLWMRQTGVLTAVLPESEKWGIDLIGRLIATEQKLAWEAESLLRLEAIVPPDAARMSALAKRLRLSNADRDRLERWALAEPVALETKPAALKKRIYREGRKPVRDRLRLAYVASMPVDGGISEPPEDLLDIADNWQPPKFPLQGKDLIAEGFETGPAMGKILSSLENEWVDGGFSVSRDDLIARAREIRRP